MFGFAATKLEEFEQGKISRRQLIQTLTAATTAVGATGAAQAQGQQVGVNPALINHVSYTCAEFKKAADWYSKLFNLEQVGLKDNEVTLPFNKMNEKPLGITANDVPPTFLLCRTRPDNTPAPGGGVRPKATNVVNHMAYTVADFDSARIQAQLKAMGVQNVRGTGPNAIHMDDAFGYDVEICGLANNALTDGA
jgi:catechol 2,3-dioxygenase-like lactoylglutathione lyase family enzyme